MIRKRTLVPILLLSSTAALAKPPPDDRAPKPLLELRDQLIEAGKDAAARDIPRFRSLCDADGYPLVGNLVRKTDVYQPSQFCALVRGSGPKT